MLIPKKLLEIITEKGIEVQKLENHHTREYKFSSTSPKGYCHSCYLDWCESFEEAVSVLKKAYKDFSVDDYACYLYKNNVCDENLTLAECIKEAKFLKTNLRKVLYEAFREVKPTDEDLFKEELSQCSDAFKKSICTRCCSRGLIEDCTPYGAYFLKDKEEFAPEEVFANYLHWMYIFEFLENTKFTEEQLKFFDENNSRVAKLLFDATSSGMQTLKEEFINNIFPDALNGLMNEAQSGESEGDNNG